MQSGLQCRVNTGGSGMVWLLNQTAMPGGGEAEELHKLLHERGSLLRVGTYYITNCITNTCIRPNYLEP